MNTDKPLTHRQKEIVDFIVTFLKDHGYPPTVREIGAATNLTSTRGVVEHLGFIIKKGWLDKVPRRARSITLTDKARRAYNIGGIHG